MITHQRRTMEMADVLFGVSMPGRRRHQGHQPKARPGPQARGVGVSGHLGDNCIEKPQGLGACIDFVASTATDLGNDAVGG